MFLSFSPLVPQYAATRTPHFLFQSIFTINVHVFLDTENETERVVELSLWHGTFVYEPVRGIGSSGTFMVPTYLHDTALRFGTRFRIQPTVWGIVLLPDPCSARRGAPMMTQKPVSMGHGLRNLHRSAKQQELGVVATHIQSLLKWIKYPWEAGQTGINVAA